MKLSHLSLSLAAALFTMPAMAQELAEAGLAPEKKPVHFEIGDVTADVGFVLFSLNDGAVLALGGLILSDAAVVMMKKEPVDGSLSYDLELPRKWSADIYWQGVTYDLTKGLRIYSIQKLTSDGDAMPAKEPEGTVTGEPVAPPVDKATRTVAAEGQIDADGMPAKEPEGTVTGEPAAPPVDKATRTVAAEGQIDADAKPVEKPAKRPQPEVKLVKAVDC